MTTPLQSDVVNGGINEFAALPAHDEPWSIVELREFNAQMLVNAVYRQRDRLLREAPYVPFQDYEVLDVDLGPSGTLCVGALITLWRNSPLCRGECPRCGDHALAFHFSGNDEDWRVYGICQLCAHLCMRAESREALMAEIARALNGTSFPAPSATQLLSGNGLRHSALHSALSALGEVFLPPLHYGFAGASPETMGRWISNLRARAWRWAGRAMVWHAQSGAPLEGSQELHTYLAQLVEQHVVRTGVLPELDIEERDGLRITFPLISNEPMTPVDVLVKRLKRSSKGDRTR